MWLSRLPPEYRRRYYTNLAVIAALVIFFFVVGRLGQANGTRAILAALCLLILYTLIFPLVRLLQQQPRPRPIAFALYAAWILSFAYAAAGLAFPALLGAGFALLLGIVLMWAFLIIYRKIVFPDFFAGGFAERWKRVRDAQRAEKAEHAAYIDSIRDDRLR